MDFLFKIVHIDTKKVLIPFLFLSVFTLKAKEENLALWLSIYRK